MDMNLYRWIRIALVNLLLVSVLGVLMRYKIAFSFPFLQQKFILHAHSHFAFAGWITQILMALMVANLSAHQPGAFRSYRPLLYANLLTAYGMLLSFPFQGYGAISITFSTLNIFTGYWFALRYWKDLNRLPVKTIAHYWFKAAVIFNVISSFGAFYLAYMMATKNLHQNWYLASVYFFLHFQYNGWFFFACMGLLAGKLKRLGFSMEWMPRVFWLFALSCIPAYFLSALWLPISIPVFVVVIASAVAQVWGGIILYKAIWLQRPLIIGSVNKTARLLLLLAAIALGIKLLLQLGSTIPALSDLAFGFRPIVIGYLHLVLLAVISLFILGYVFGQGYLHLNKATRTGVYVFTAGIFLNELFLMIQGVSALSYAGVPYMDISLLAAGLVMFAGLLVMNLNLGAANDQSGAM